MTILTDDTDTKGILNKATEDVKDISLYEDVISNMVKMLEKNSDWAGLAAPQIGLSKSIFVVRLEKGIEVVVNPTIKYGKNIISGSEGCLSRPDIFCETRRSRKITVSYQDENGKLIRRKILDKFAVRFQHEFDHLKGILIS